MLNLELELIIDSLKKGRRDGDLLGDIYFPHMHYFASYVIEDIMSRYGFEKVYLDSEIKGIFRYKVRKKLRSRIIFYE